MDVEMERSVLSFPVLFEIAEEVQIDDDRFTKVRVFLMHTGENYNKSVFDKAVIEAAIPTLEYIPIVGFIEGTGDEKDFSDHRYILVRDENGLRRKYIGSAYGVITSNADNKAHFETRLCDDGIEREFLVVDGLLWNMFEDSASIMNRDLIKGHSMELFDKNIDGYEDEDGLFHFTKFSFRAACILGDDKEAAMQNSTIEVQFTMSDFVRSIQGELNNKYTSYMKTISAKAEQEEGGNVVMQGTDFSQSVMQMFDDIATIVSAYETYVDRWRDVWPRYALVDIQDNEIIVMDRKDNYRYYAFAFTMDGDKPVIDFTNPVRKKVRYENYEEGTDGNMPEGAFNFAKEIEEISNAASAQITTAENDKNVAVQNYETLKSDYDEMKPKFDQYVQDEQERVANELKAQKETEFSRFEKVLGENEEFKSLKEQIDSLSLTDITSQCSILYTRLNLENKTDFSKGKQEPGALSIGVAGDGDEDGFVNTKYGLIPVKR